MSSFGETVRKERPVLDGLAQSNLVSIFDFVAHRNPSGERGDLDVGKFGELAEDIEVGRISLHRRTQGQNHLVDGMSGRAGTLAHPLHQTIYLQLLRTDAVHRRNQTAQYMIETSELAGGLDHHHLLDILHHAYRRSIALHIGADRANLCIADIVANLAIFHLIAQTYQALPESDGPSRLLPQQMQHETQGGLTSNARQIGKLVNRIGQ